MAKYTFLESLKSKDYQEGWIQRTSGISWPDDCSFSLSVENNEIHHSK